MIKAEVIDIEGEVIFTAIVPDVPHDQLFNDTGAFGTIDVARALLLRLNGPSV